ncbi:MAG TPA: transglutaminase domain-containing protein [Chitinophaga sp.]
MNKAAHFGATFSGPAFYLQDALKTIIAGKQTNLEKTKAIYYWLQQNMARDKDNSLFAATSLKKAFDSRRGNSSAINLLLMAMLKEAGIAAWPIILSTRDHGFIYEQYPLITRFNYTVAQVKLYEGEFVLDASEPLLGFGKLPLRCYNGAARLMTPDAPPVYFYADSLQEGDLTSVRLQMDNAGNLSGSVDEIQGYHHSLESRQQIKASGVVALEKSLATSLGDDPVVQHLQLHNADSLEAPLGISFDFTLPENKTQDLIYLSPMLGQSFAANPFTAAERLYPVEMPVARQDSYTLNFTLPDNYAVEELPQSASFKLPDGSAGFRYIIQQEGHNVQLRVVLRFKKATFKPEEYGGLRAFFDDVVKKEAEQIVLKRK